MNFAEGKQIGEPGNLEQAPLDLGKDPDKTIARAHEADIEERLSADTRFAIDSGMFGSPSFRVGDELFWGDDRLEDALEWCVTGKISQQLGYA